MIAGKWVLVMAVMLLPMLVLALGAVVVALASLWGDPEMRKHARKLISLLVAPIGTVIAQRSG